MKIVRYISKVKDMKKNTRTISQQNAHRKAYEEKLKNKVKDVPKRRKCRQIGTHDLSY